MRVYCLALGGMDLTSPAGKMTMGVINAVAQFERDLLIERTQSGLQRAKAEGVVLGRPVIYWTRTDGRPSGASWRAAPPCRNWRGAMAPAARR